MNSINNWLMNTICRIQITRWKPPLTMKTSFLALPLSMFVALSCIPQSSSAQLKSGFNPASPSGVNEIKAKSKTQKWHCNPGGHCYCKPGVDCKDMHSTLQTRLGKCTAGKKVEKCERNWLMWNWITLWWCFSIETLNKLGEFSPLTSYHRSLVHMLGLCYVIQSKWSIIVSMTERMNVLLLYLSILFKKIGLQIQYFEREMNLLIGKPCCVSCHILYLI